MQCFRPWGNRKNAVYEKFLKRYERVNKLTGKKQYVVPYLMSSHPGSTLKEAVELAEYLRDLGYMPEQVQDFLSDTGYDFYLYVLYRRGSPHRQENLCAKEPS